ncbi:pentapeptide repeat-containing protein [Nonomuraea sp. NBC_00507]|uniref:pentapeptide repeat-containing protein n=1 Tax=Nonomuraea sp. NBC_00507 TaxID=2976002 RepID=UPI002E185185
MAATIEGIPDWGRWILAGTALAGISTLGIAALIGPAARRLAGEQHPLTQAERQQMTATERVEAVNAARHTLIQAATGLVVIGGVVFTAQGLWYTAQSLDASRQAQRTAEQGQITDRYIKAVEQLGSTKMDVRLGGIYALERLAKDSPRDHQTVYEVLAAFVREHDHKLKPGVRVPGALATDAQAALTVIGRRDVTLDTRGPNLVQSRIARADLRQLNLAGADLYDTDLAAADLRSANLNGANLTGAKLLNADLTGANLAGAKLRGTNLVDVDLAYADLRGADLAGVDLGGTYLVGADLRGADLRHVRGVTVDEIRKETRVDETTKF